jgi:hypothetical protein
VLIHRRGVHKKVVGKPQLPNHTGHGAAQFVYIAGIGQFRELTQWLVRVEGVGSLRGFGYRCIVDRRC